MKLPKVTVAAATAAATVVVGGVAWAATGTGPMALIANEQPAPPALPKPPAAPALPAPPAVPAPQLPGKPKLPEANLPAVPDLSKLPGLPKLTGGSKPSCKFGPATGGGFAYQVTGPKGFTFKRSKVFTEKFKGTWVCKHTQTFTSLAGKQFVVQRVLVPAGTSLTKFAGTYGKAKSYPWRAGGKVAFEYPGGTFQGKAFGYGVYWVARPDMAVFVAGGRDMMDKVRLAADELRTLQ